MQTPGASSNLLAVMLAAISAAAVIVLLGLLLGAGEGSCPADTGRVPVRTLDGRTLCVVPADLDKAAR